MSEFLGEEFIKIRPDTSTFRQELESQVAAAQTGVQQRVAASARAAGGIVLPPTVPQAPAVSEGGVVLPPRVAAPIKEATAATVALDDASQHLGTTARASSEQLNVLSRSSRNTANATESLHRSVQAAEGAAGRYTRGLVAATAASTGFFRAVSFASGAFLVGAAVGATIGTAVNEFTNMTQVAAQTAALIKATGGAANVTATQVDQLSKRTLALTGVDDELVKQGANVLLTFRNIRNEVGQGNDIFNRAVKASLDISSVFRTDLRGSAVQLGKALQDPVKSVTALRRSGISLSQSQRDLIKELVDSGRILQAQKLILGEVERQVGGTAEAIGKTLPGQLRIAREESTNSLGELVKRLSESERAADLASEAISGVRQTVGDVRSVVQAVGPLLADVAQGFGKATQAVGGVSTILEVVVAYKAVSTALGFAKTAQNLYAEASLASAAAAAAETGALEAEAIAINTVSTRSGALTFSTAAQTAALEAQGAATATVTAEQIAGARAAQAQLSALTGLSGIFAIGAAASGHYATALLFGGTALAGVAFKARAAVQALRAVGTAVTFGRVALAAFGGPLQLAAIAAGGLAITLFKLSQRASSLPGGLKASTKAVNELTDALDRNLRLRAAVGTAREQLGVARFDEQAAQRDLERARNRQQNTTAQPGSLQAQFLAEQVTEAEDKLAQAQQRVRDAQAGVDTARGNAAANERRQAEITERITKNIQNQIQAFARLRTGDITSRVEGLTRAFLQQGLSLEDARAKAEDVARAELAFSGKGTQAAKELNVRWAELGETTKGAGAAAAKAVAVIGSEFNRLPTQKEIKIIVTAALQGKSAAQILREIGAVTAPGDTEQRRLDANIKITKTIKQQALEAQGALRAERQKLNVIDKELTKRKDALNTARLERQAAQDAVESAKEGREAAIEGLASAERGLSDAHQSLADTIRQANESISAAIKASQDAVKSSIKDAKSNLDSLGSAIAEALGNFRDEGGKTTSSLGKRFRELRDQIRRGQGGPETERAAQELRFRIQNQPSVGGTDKIKQQFADLTDAVNRGTISLPNFRKRLQELLKGFNLDAFRSKFGTAAANLVSEQIAKLRAQAAINLRTTRPPQFALPNARGLVQRGNIDINNRPIVRNRDGTISTERSFSIGTNKGEVLLPQVINGVVVPISKAIQHFRETGENLGTFATVAAAEAYARLLHTRQGQLFGAQQGRGLGAQSPDVVNPLKAVAEGAKQIANARREAARDIARAERDLGDATKAVTKAQQDITKSNRTLAAAERRLQAAESKERRAQTRETQQNTKAMKQLTKVIGARKALEEKRPKPQGDQGKTATGLVAHGATNP